MIHSILQQQSRWLRVGTCSLVLGISSLFLATGSALAVPSVTLTDTLVGDEPGSYACLIVDPDSGKCAIGTSGDFYLGNQKVATQGLGDGINERYVGEFDLTTMAADYAIFLDPTYHLQSAMVELVIIPVIDAKNDGFWLGSVLTGDFDVDNILAPGEVPYNLADHSPVTLNINLLDYYTTSEIMNFITGGDDNGTVWIRLGDDHFVMEATLTVTATQMPEPASLILLGTGLVGMAAWRSRKTRQNQ